MTYEQAKPYVGFVVDDSGNGRMTTIENDRHASRCEKYRPVLVGWQCGFEPVFIAVYSYLDVRLNDDDAIDIATEYLSERKWFAGEETDPDYVIR